MAVAGSDKARASPDKCQVNGNKTRNSIREAMLVA